MLCKYNLTFRVQVDLEATKGPNKGETFPMPGFEIYVDGFDPDKPESWDELRREITKVFDGFNEQDDGEYDEDED